MDRSVLSGDALARALALRDLSDPAQGPHAMQLIVESLVDAVGREGVPVVVHRGPRIVDVEDNYDRLRYVPDAVARDVRYSRYVDERRMLRSHTSATIPRLLAAVAGQTEPAGDRVLVCPGIVYRRDAIDKLHTGEPHQIDLWRVRRADRGMQPLGIADLRALIRAAAAAVLPRAEVRATSTSHPYTIEGLQIDVRLARGGDWLEIGECGLAHPEVLAASGLDPSRWSGLAMGLGLDRLLMLDKGIDDIRLLRATDPRIAVQMLDRSPYRPISDRPPIRRDLSVVVKEDDAVEDMGDRVRVALGAEADIVEEVVVAAQTSYEALPQAARDRLRIEPWQKNVLVRVVLRHVSRTLTHAAANVLRNRIYAAIHCGRTSEWASTRVP